jgi:hypothetical protein
MCVCILVWWMSSVLVDQRLLLWLARELLQVGASFMRSSANLMGVISDGAYYGGEGSHTQCHVDMFFLILYGLLQLLVHKWLNFLVAKFSCFYHQIVCPSSGGDS